MQICQRETQNHQGAITHDFSCLAAQWWIHPRKTVEFHLCLLAYFESCHLVIGYPISLLTPKTTPLCPSKDLRGPALGHPEVYRLNPDLPRPLKCRGPLSDWPALSSQEPSGPCPRAPWGLQSQPRPAPTPEMSGSCLGVPGTGPRSEHTKSYLAHFSR